MTDRISTDELRHADLARRFYHHVLHGGSLTADDVSIMVQSIEKLEAEVIELREALERVRRETLEEAAMQVEAIAGDDAMWVADAIRDLIGTQQPKGEEITALRERLEQAERAGFRAGIEAAAEMARDCGELDLADYIENIATTDNTTTVTEAAKVICDAWDADTLPVNDPDPMLPSFIAALRALADNATTVAEADREGPYTCRSCCAATWNDCDVCDDCILAAQKGEPQ